MTSAYHKGKTKPLLSATIGQHLEKVVAKYPDNLALIVPFQNIRWTYAEFNKRIDKLAMGLLKLGINKGDRVGIWSPNRFEWVLVQFATAKIGAIMVCINPAYRVRELEYALSKVECKAIVCAESFKTSMYIDMLNELAPEIKTSQPGHLKSAKLPHLTTIIRMGDDETPGMFNFTAVMAMGGAKERENLKTTATRIDSNEAINIQFTSGTTGTPKGATLSHHNILNNAYYAGITMKFSSADSLCIPVPLYHCMGMVLGTLTCMTHGATIVLPCESFEPIATLETLSNEKCTAMHGVPTMFMATLEAPDFETYDLSPLRTGIIAGSSCPIELMKRLISDMELTEIIIGYGQTETSPINSMTEIDDTMQQRVSTVGAAHYNLEQKITRGNGSTADIGEQGEICSRGYGVMLGYWNDDIRTQETIDADGWLHSGDLGAMDADGYVKVTGRIKDMIIRGGENIYPREIEEYLYTHPDILEVQVFGIPDKKFGEQVCAWVQLHEGVTLTTEGVQTFCKDNIAHFKIPKFVRLVTEFPMTVTGKMQKFVMRDEMIKTFNMAD